MDNFDWEKYVNKYDDLKNIRDMPTAILHWINYGKFEDRYFSPNDIITKYDSMSDIKKYIDKYGHNGYQWGTVYKNNPNHLDLDLYFYKKANNINLVTKDDILDNFYGNLQNGIIYHPLQLKNLLGDIEIIQQNADLYVGNVSDDNKLSNYINKFVYTKTFDDYADILVRKLDEKISEHHSLLILVFVGNMDVGCVLIDKLIKYKSMEKFSIGFCLGKRIESKFIELIKNSFTNYFIYESNECGNDIIPTILMYSDIVKNIKFKSKIKHIIKLHTKNDKKKFSTTTDFLLGKKLDNLIKFKKPDCNCIGTNNFYVKLDKDVFNKILVTKYKDHINMSYCFVSCTIFYTTPDVFDFVLDFMKHNNHIQFFLNNMYDDNSIFWDKSSVHFLERLFGVAKLE